jgi:hypothetical protein
MIDEERRRREGQKEERRRINWRAREGRRLGQNLTITVPLLHKPAFPPPQSILLGLFLSLL